MAVREPRPIRRSRSGAISRRSFLRRAGLATGAALGAGGGLFWYGASFEPNQLETTHLRIPLRSLPPAFDGLTVAQVSDLHLGRYTSARRVRQVVDAVMALRPELIVVTGDHVDRLSHGEAEVLAGELSRLSAQLGVYAILGNHDHWTDADTVAGALVHAGLRLLRNARARLELEGQVLYLAGVDDVWERKHDLGRALDGLPPQACVVLLAHEPDLADEVARDGRVGLQLSGHSHGGQIVVPGLGPPVLPTLGQKYPSGLRQVREMWLYTNRGIGMVNPPFRLNCPPEITLLTLQASIA